MSQSNRQGMQVCLKYKEAYSNNAVKPFDFCASAVQIYIL